MVTVRHSSPWQRSVCNLLALVALLLAGTNFPASAAAGDGKATIVVGEPAGFAQLTEAQSLLVDVYFGGVRKGEARVLALPGAVYFSEPIALLGLLPALTEPRAIEMSLGAGYLPANAHLACSRSTDPRNCGRLAPETVGVILDREKFRIDIFLNPRFIAVEDRLDEVFLPEPQRNLAMINALGAVVSGRLEGKAYFNLQDNLILANGARRLRADLFYASRIGLGADRIALEWDRPGVRYSAGALWSPGSELAGKRKLLGLGLESQIDTRRDRDEILGSPVVVYLSRRARVDVVRDGRIINSSIYDAGNQQIDTSNLPDGSYDIVLRIQESGQVAREERRFYTKSRRIPSEGRTDFFVFAGLLINGFQRGSLDASERPYVQGGIASRLSERWALAGAVEATDKGAAAELSAIWLTPLAQLRAAAVADFDGGYGGIVQLNSAGTSRLNFNFDLRRIKRADHAGPRESPVGLPDSPFAFPDIANPVSSYAQFGGVVSYSVANLRFLGTAIYRDEEMQRARYSLGPSLEWDALRWGRLTVTMRGDLAATERGNSGFAGISLRALGARSSATALVGTRASKIAGDELGEGPVASLGGTWSPTFAGGELALGAGLDHQPKFDNIILSSEFRHQRGSVSADVVHSNGMGPSVTQYSLGMQTALVAGSGIVELARESTAESVIVAAVTGASAGDTFELLVNEQIAGVIVGNRPLTLALPSYRAYQVRIRPTGASLLAYDNATRSVALYPGSVSNVDWTVAPISIKLGRLVTPDGEPVRGASINGHGVWSETDDEGYFQIAAPDNAELTVTFGDGNAYSIMLPDGEPKADIARVGQVVCCRPGEILLGSLNVPANPDNRNSQ